VSATKVLLLYPGSLWGGAWAARPTVKPELVSLYTYLRRHDVDVDVLDLEAELGNPAPGGQEEFLRRAGELIGARQFDVLSLSCWSSMQYAATAALARQVRAERPEAIIAVGGYHVTAQPEDFLAEDTPYTWVIAGEGEQALVAIAAAVAGGDREAGTCRVLDGTPLPLTAENLPDYSAYPYTRKGLAVLPVSLSRGCPYHCASCVIQPGEAGWRAFPPDEAVKLLDQVAALEPKVIEVTDPTFGYDNLWRTPVLARLSETFRRAVPIVVTARPDHLTRADVDGFYTGLLRVHLDVDTLARDLIEGLGIDPFPSKYVEHALDIARYANAKGVPGDLNVVFGQPGETRATAAETIERLEELMDGLPNASLALRAKSWAYFPDGAPGVSAEAAAERFGAQIVHPEWWKEAAPYGEAAMAVVPSRDLADEAPGSDAYWRPRFTALAAKVEAKLTADAKRLARSHESVGSAAEDVPHGYWHSTR